MIDFSWSGSLFHGCLGILSLSLKLKRFRQILNLPLSNSSIKLYSRYIWFGELQRRLRVDHRLVTACWVTNQQSRDCVWDLVRALCPFFLCTHGRWTVCCALASKDPITEVPRSCLHLWVSKVWTCYRSRSINFQGVDRVETAFPSG